MNKRQKGMLIVAILITTVGSLVFVISLMFVGFPAFVKAFSALGSDYAKSSAQKYDTDSWEYTNSQKYDMSTYEFREDFDKISINEPMAKITFALSDNEICKIKIECLENRKEKYSVVIQDGILMINAVDTQKWYDQSEIDCGSEYVTVYLPKSEYNSLSIETDTGDVDISGDFVFHQIDITGDTANILCKGLMSDDVELRTDTGDIHLDTMNVSGAVLAETDTGGIRLNSLDAGSSVSMKSDTGTMYLTDVNCKDFAANSDTGDIHLKKVLAETISIVSDTGEVEFESCDANSLDIETDTGDVTGTLLSDKIFLVETSLGNVDVQKTTTGGMCKITTDSGDIQIGFTDTDEENDHI